MPTSPPLTPTERAKRAADARWTGHAKKIVRLDDLTPDQRRVVLAMVDAAKAAKAAGS